MEIGSSCKITDRSCVEGEVLSTLVFCGSFLRSVSSYSWKSIWGSKSLLKEGLLWRVGDGKNIKILKDTWVCNKGKRFLNGLIVEGIERVCDIIDHDRAC